MKKSIKLVTIITALNLVTVNGLMLTFSPDSDHYVYLNKHDANASLLKWKLSPEDAKMVKNMNIKSIKWQVKKVLMNLISCMIIIKVM